MEQGASILVMPDTSCDCNGYVRNLKQQFIGSVLICGALAVRKADISGDLSPATRNCEKVRQNQRLLTCGIAAAGGKQQQGHSEAECLHDAASLLKQ